MGKEKILQHTIQSILPLVRRHGDNALPKPTQRKTSSVPLRKMQQEEKSIEWYILCACKIRWIPHSGSAKVKVQVLWLLFAKANDLDWTIGKQETLCRGNFQWEIISRLTGQVSLSSYRLCAISVKDIIIIIVINEEEIANR